MSRRYGKIFKDRVKAVHGDEYSVIGDYVNHKTRIRVKHNVCETEMDVFPSHFVKKQVQCPNPECRHDRMMFKYGSEFYNRLDTQGKFTAISEYDGIDTPMTFCCKQCGCIFTINKAGRIFETPKISHCPDCYSEHVRVREEERYKAKLENKFGDEFELCGNYNGYNNEVQILHKKCGNVSTYYRASKVLTDYLSPCRTCAITKGEKAIATVLDKLNIEYKFQQKYKDLLGKNNKSLTYDFCIPSYNLLIEYQGEFHDGSAAMMTDDEFESQKERDRKKKEYAKSHHINLLEIWYWDFNNIETILTDYFNSYNLVNEEIAQLK